MINSLLCLFSCLIRVRASFGRGRVPSWSVQLICWVVALVVAQPCSSRAALPVTVAAPKGINLGSTSFFDGFGRTVEGWTWLQYGRFENLNRINDKNGNPNPHFNGTDIRVYVAQTQISYTSSWHPFGGDGVGVSAIIPIVDYSSSFARNSPAKLTSNDIGIGDLCIGPFYQSKYRMAGGRPIFAWRAQLRVYVPTGNFDGRRNINQGSGSWAINPFIAMTWVPLPRLEFSTRIHYQYNLETSKLASPPTIPGLLYRNGQAGQLLYGNFDMSYEISHDLYLGVNGYALRQLTDDRTNGQNVPGSRETAVSIGPGARYVFDASKALNVNLYLPVVAENTSSGIEVNFQFVKRF